MKATTVALITMNLLRQCSIFIKIEKIHVSRPYPSTNILLTGQKTDITIIIYYISPWESLQKGLFQKAYQSKFWKNMLFKIFTGRLKIKIAS